MGIMDHSSLSDLARNTASVRVLTASFKKICLTCDFTVSGETARARATALFVEPWPIITRISRSRSVKLLWPSSCVECDPSIIVSSPVASAERSKRPRGLSDALSISERVSPLLDGFDAGREDLDVLYEART